MKITIKKVLLALVAAIIILIAIAAIYFYPVITMSPAKTGEIPGTSIYAAKNVMGAVYFVKTNAGYIMVDAGTDAKGLLSTMGELNIGTNEVKWILITHSDYDHVSGLALFPGAKIYMNEDEMKMLDGTEKRNASKGNSLPAGVNVNAVNLLGNGQKLTFGGIEVECLKAPGHTIGSMLYLVDGSYLFTGDAFSLSKGKLGIHPFTMDKERARQTIDEFRDTVNNSRYVLSTHYGYYPILFLSYKFQ